MVGLSLVGCSATCYATLSRDTSGLGRIEHQTTRYVAGQAALVPGPEKTVGRNSVHGGGSAVPTSKKRKSFTSIATRRSARVGRCRGLDRLDMASTPQVLSARVVLCRVVGGTSGGRRVGFGDRTGHRLG